MNLADQADIFAAQVRSLQNLHPRAHAELTEWGIWSRDRSGIFPSLTQNSMWEQFIHDETDGWGEPEGMGAGDAPVKSERDEERPADEKLAVSLDEWLHEHMAYNLRRTLLVAYVLTMAIYQYPKAATSPRERPMQPEDYLARFERALTMIEGRT